MPEYTVQRLGKRFAIVVPQGGGKRTRIRLSATDRSSAEAEARVLFRNVASEPLTVGRIVSEYINDREAAEIASTGRQRDAWKAMKGFWENVDPERIDDAMCRKYAEARKVGPSTLRYELSMLSVALRHAKKPMPVWRPPAPERQVRHLTHSQFERWYAEVKAPHARLYALLGLFTMARPSAILELTWGRVDFERRQIDLNPRGRRQTKKRRKRQSAEQNVAMYADEAREARERAERERHRANGYKGHATRITKRAKAGVCPCCNRTFKQLAQHMANKHPTFTPLALEDRPPEGATVQ